MEISFRALITLIHGMLFGAFFLMATYAVVVELLRSPSVDLPAPLALSGGRLQSIYLAVVVGAGWAAVFSGAYVVYPWYRAVPAAGLAHLTFYPRYFLKSSPATAGWHDIGMEWKEHVAWVALIAMSMVAHVLVQHRGLWRENRQVRTGVLVFALAALASAGVAGFFGAMLNKYAPISGGANIHLLGMNQ